MRVLSIGIIHIAVLAVSGCAEIAAPPEAEADQALTTDFVDGSGTVMVRITQCAPSPLLAHVTTTCSVDAGYVLIGGGAEIIGEGSPGALLTASFPDPSLTTWTASSKDQHLAFAHRLSAYAVGLKLAGVSPSALRGSMVMVSSRSSPAAHPAAAATVPAGYTLIGGGARANWVTEGQLLVSSVPSDSQWIATSKDHLVAEVGTVDAFAIGVTGIPGFGALDVITSQVITGVPTGYGAANLGVPAGWVLASIGGKASYASEGRMLTDLVPFVDAPADNTAGATVRSKDHEKRDAGSTWAYVTAIRKH
jgi:vibriolysin